METAILGKKLIPLLRHNNSTKHNSIIRSTEKATTNSFHSSFYKDLKMKEKRNFNLARLNEVIEFEHNWNGNQAPAFEKDLVNKVINLINALEYQPDVFPTARESIQIEYEKNSGEYLEFEIFMDKINMLYMDQQDKEIEETLPHDAFQLINEKISDFHAGNFQ